MRKIFSLILILLFVSQSARAIENKQPRDLVVKTLSGENFDLKSLRGKVVIVSFWAYWCKDCLLEMAELETLYKKYHARGLEIIGITIDKKNDMPKILKRSETVSYPNALLVEATSNNFPDLSGLPTTYIFDQQGRELLLIGGRSQEEFEQVLQQIL